MSSNEEKKTASPESIDPEQQAVLDAKGLVTSAKDTACTRATEAKEVVSSMVEGTKEATQESVEMAKSAVLNVMNAMKETTMGQMVGGGIGKMLEKFKELVDHYLPVTDEVTCGGLASTKLHDLLHKMQSQALGVSYNIVQLMQAACQNLLANMQGLPEALQEKVQQAYGSMEELQAAFSSAKSFQDFPVALVTQSQEKISKAREVVDEVMEFVMQNAPLTWVVGPSSPARSSVAEPTEVQAKADA